jgi:hypothetical protein
MQDRPTYAELLAAVRKFIEDDVVPQLDGPKKFHARVAANVLAILERERGSEDSQLPAECNRLAALLDAPAPAPNDREALRRLIGERTRRLCERIAAGDADRGPWRAAVLDHVRQTVREKLEVANPGYLESDDRLSARRRATQQPGD